MIERSCCIKCPTVAEQLVGTKKIQQVMAVPGVVEKFIHEPEAVGRIRKTFAKLYSLDEVSYSEYFHLYPYFVNHII